MAKSNFQLPLHSPFFANKGYHPNLTIHPERDLVSSHAKNLVVNLDELHQELKATIAELRNVIKYQQMSNVWSCLPSLSVNKPL